MIYKFLNFKNIIILPSNKKSHRYHINIVNAIEIYSPNLTQSDLEIYCNFRRCVGLGEPCGEQKLPLTGPVCYQPYRCYNGYCTEPLKTGEKCNFTIECNSLTGDYCVETEPGNRVCLPASFAFYNEDCERSSDCILGLECIFSQSLNKKVCGTPHDGCITDSHCENSSVCINRTCTHVNMASNECILFASVNDCFGSFCVPTSNSEQRIGVCAETTKVGDPCITTRATCDYFTKNQYCKLTNGTVFGTCEETPEPTYRLCNKREECENYEFCKCDLQSSVGYCTTRAKVIGENCYYLLALYYECAAKTNCSGGVFNLHPKSCAYQKCSNLAKCVKKFCVDPLLSSQICYKEEQCNLQDVNVNVDYTLNSDNIPVRNNQITQYHLISFNLNIITILSTIYVINLLS